MAKKVNKEKTAAKKTTAKKADSVKKTATNKKAVEIDWELDKPVREDIFEYIID